MSNSAEAQRLYALDASIYIFKAWFGREPRFYSAEGYPLNAVEGYLQTLLKCLSRLQPRYFFAAFDESLGQGFREALYPPYKSRRGLPDEALAYQLDACRKMTGALGVYHWASQEFEADDLLATAAAEANRHGRLVTVLSRDKDLAQIMTEPADAVMDIGSPARSRLQWQEAQGLSCKQLPDYLALVGDAVDDIPGVAGIGPVSATEILKKYPTLEAVFEHLDALHELPCRGAKTLAGKLLAQRDELFLFRKLCRLRDDVPLPEDWQQGIFTGADAAQFIETGVECGLPENWLKAQCRGNPWLFEERARAL
jgi:5'-3' exonuclease